MSRICVKTWMALSERNIATRERTLDLANKYVEQGAYKRAEKLLNLYDLMVEDSKELFRRI